MPNTNSYVPSKPYRAITHCNMSQDVISTAKIVVDSISTRPVATFRRQAASQTHGGAAVEALVVASTEGAGRRVCHVARDTRTEAGWRLTPLFGENVSEVAAGVAYFKSASPGVHGFFVDGPGLFSSQFDGANWSTPQAILLPKDIACTNLRVTYTPGGAVVLYGQTAEGNLITVTQTSVDGSFTATVCDMGGALKSGVFSLCMLDEQPWTLAANIEGVPWLFTGATGETHFGSKQKVDGFSGQLAQIATGYYNAAQNAWIFLLVDTDGAIHSCSQSDDAHTVKAIPNAKAKLTSAAGHVSDDDDSTLHVYATDADQGLWVLHQSKMNPWNDDGTPNWVPPIPLAKGVTGIFSDMNPASAPALFALDGELALRLHHQDSVTSLWKSGHVHQAASEAFEVVRFRAEVNLYDANGMPLAGESVSLSLAKDGSAVDVSVRNELHAVQTGAPAQLKTDASGKLSFAVMANAGMACPDLSLNADGLAKPVPISPSGGLHTYLSGNGVLNPTNPNGPLPVFDADGKTLTAANGGKLAPGAAGKPQLAATVASAIQNTARAGKGDAAAAGIVGYAADFTPGNERFHEITSAEELAGLLAGRGEVTGFWDELADFFGDIWEGIKNAAIAIKNFIVDAASKVAHFVIEIGEWIAKEVKLVIEGIEHAAHFIAGIFNAIGAAIEKVIDWLKALFDFGAIWRTKMAFEEVLLAVPDRIAQALKSLEKSGDDWFTKEKEKLDAAFDTMKKSYAGHSFGMLPGWQSPSKGPSDQKLAGKASPADFVTNVHHNWLTEKVNSHPPDEHAVRMALGGDDPFAGFKQRLAESANDFQKFFADLGNAIRTMFTHPGEFDTVVIPDLLDAVKNCLDGVITFFQALFDAVLEFGEVAMKGLHDLLDTPLHLGFLNTLWGWMAGLAGYSKDTRLTPAAIISLVAAFPSTIIFKLIAGVDKEPFPSGHFVEGKAGGPMMAIEMPWQCVLTSNVLQLLQFIPAVSADIIGNAAPGWLTGLSIGMSLLIWVLANGYPTAFQTTVGLGLLPALLPLAQAAYTTPFFMKNRDDIFDVLMSVYGLLKLSLGIYTVVEGDPGLPSGHKIAAIMLPLGPLFGFLNLSPIRDSEAGPFAIVGNVVFDFTAYIGGGLGLLLDTLIAQHIIAVEAA